MLDSYLIKNKDISELSNFKTPAMADYYFEIHNGQDVDRLYEIYKFSKDKNLKILFIGGGTNLLFAFENFKGIVIKNCLKGWTYDDNNMILEAYSIESISDIAKSLFYNNGQKLWKRFIGLPGSIGGAVFGNAGCFGLETENNFIEAEVFDFEAGKTEIFKKEDMGFEYRNSIIKKTNQYFIVKAKFDLSMLIEKYDSDVDNIDFRENKQPKGNTCGSFFKNPSKESSAGMLIEHSGLKGKKIGGAYFSEQHANFLMSDGTASYKDLINLIELAKNEVNEKFKINLIPEVRIITN